MLRQLLLQFSMVHTSFNFGGEVGSIKLKEAVHMLEAEDDAVVLQRCTHVLFRAITPRDDWHTIAVGDFNHLTHVVSIGGKNDQ